jgi:hypothetical protein
MSIDELEGFFGGIPAFAYDTFSLRRTELRIGSWHPHLDLFKRGMGRQVFSSGGTIFSIRKSVRGRGLSAMAITGCTLGGEPLSP